MKTNNLFSAVKDKLFNKSNLTEMKESENSTSVQNLQINSQANLKIMRTLKNNLVLVAALFIAAGTMSFKMMEKIKAQSTVLLYFDGNPLIASQVADETRWAEDNPALSCGTGDNKACSMRVDISDVTGINGVRILNTLHITLDAATNGIGLGYYPVKDGGSSFNSIEAINKD